MNSEIKNIVLEISSDNNKEIKFTFKNENENEYKNQNLIDLTKDEIEDTTKFFENIIKYINENYTIKTEIIPCNNEIIKEIMIEYEKILNKEISDIKNDLNKILVQ